MAMLVGAGAVCGGPPTKEERRLYSAGKGPPYLPGFSEKQKAGWFGQTERRDIKSKRQAAELSDRVRSQVDSLW